MPSKTKKQRKEEIKKVATKFQNELKNIIGNKLLKTTYSANIHYTSNVNAVLGLNYYNQKWFIDNKERLNDLINKYNNDTSIIFAYNEVSGLYFMLT